MLSDYTPILFQTPKEFSYIELYVIHDIHKGNAYFMDKKWQAVKQSVLDAPNRYLVFLGDAMENAVPGSKSDVFEQTMSPQDQKEWFASELCDLADRTVAVVDGNHERNRSTKNCGLYPLYDCCLIAGIGDRYRPHFAFVDIGVGTRAKDPNQQTHYVGYLIHKARDTKMYSSADFVEGIDFMAYGHDHDPREHPRGKLIYNPILKTISTRSVETVNSGSFVGYGGYSVDGAYRPSSDKTYKLIMTGDKKSISSYGFYV